MRSFRVDDEDWYAAKAAAEAAGLSWNDELRKFVKRYAKRSRRPTA
jgi:antitoxin component of RelBE/YafQ-DinJ toxin-antitoxin module